MSGTSLDGIDVAFVEISGAGIGLTMSLRSFSAVPFDEEMRGRLLTASVGDISLREAFELDADLGALYADTIAAAAERGGIDLATLDAVGLHGQTVYHAPGRRPNGVTVQLGSAALVARRLGTIVVNDFRSADVAAGGQGAPLVPYCDYLLLRRPDAARVALNIGGMANITWLPRDADPAALVAFDTGPGNVLIDAAMRELHGRDYDAGGLHASQGSPDPILLGELLSDPYYRLPPPKSTGRERFGEETGRVIARRGLDAGLFPDDIIATLTSLTAATIASGIRDHAAGAEAVDEVIVGGGGAHNMAMMRMLGEELPGSAIIAADDVGIPSDGKEAICFAILANEALNEVPANVPSVTGAARPVVCGAIRVP